MLATEYAKYYGIEAQRDDENDFSFRSRVAGALRDMGNLIEAHEAQQDARWDDESKGDAVQSGIMGALAQALHGVDYHSKGERQIGDDIAVGIIVNDKRPRLTPDMALLMVKLFGRR